MNKPTPCPEWADILAARMPEDLSPSQRDALTRHLASCQRCAQASQDYDALTVRIRSASQEDRFLGLTHQLARLRTEMRNLRKSDTLAPAPIQDGSSLQPSSILTSRTRKSTRARQTGGAPWFDGILRVTDEMQLHYRIIGNGPYPLLIPTIHWQPEACKDLLPQHTLVFYDRHQRRMPNRSLHAVSSLEWELEALCQHLDLAQVSLVGWSRFGGMATHYALEHAERIARLLLIRPVAEFSIRDDLPAQGQKNEVSLRSWWETSTSHSITESRETGLPEASFNRIPTLIIHGKDDPLPVSSSQTWAATLPNSRLLTMPDVGASPWNDAPHAFFTVVAQFLMGTWPQDAISIEAKSA
jgi:pimeloyl-ACP methyl ester carboxylesterase